MTLFSKLNNNAKSSFLNAAQRFGKNLLSAAQKLFNRLVKSGNWNLKDEVAKVGWQNAEHGGAEAKKWLRSEITKHADWLIRREFMEPGKLYLFEYAHPKYETILDFYDAHPLVLGLPTYRTESGDIIERGINLHLLPLGARIDLMCAVFDLCAKAYQGEMYRERQSPISLVRWEIIKPIVCKFGGDFAFRSYIPNLKRAVIQFPYEEMPKAIFIPSNRYEKKSATQILQMYLQHCKDKKLVYRPKDMNMA